MALKGAADQIPLYEAVFLVQGADRPAKPQPNRERWYRNIDQTVSEPFVDEQTGDVYVLRTLAVRPKHAPDEWQDVRVELERDVKLQHGAERAAGRGEPAGGGAGQVGLDEAVKENPALAAKLAPQPQSRPGLPTPPAQPAVKTPEPFARKEASQWSGKLETPWIRALGPGPQTGFVDLAFSLGDKKTTTQPVRVAVWGPKGQRRWVVVELVDLLHVTNAEYAEDRKWARGLVMTDLYTEFECGWLSRDNIRARVNFVAAHPEEDKAKEKTNEGADEDTEY